MPYFLTALQLAARTDYVLTISERIARQLGPALGLRVVEVPLPLRPYALSLLWHPRFDGDAAHRFCAQVFAGGPAGGQRSARAAAHPPRSHRSEQRRRAPTTRAPPALTAVAWLVHPCMCCNMTLHRVALLQSRRYG
ncbi:MAG: hypothetical protein IPI49_15610 [Myxococcales bacterium]|nr:hypothetical protein [Myxococcales bacterium]